MDPIERPKTPPTQHRHDTLPDVDPDAFRSDLSVRLRKLWATAERRAPLYWADARAKAPLYWARATSKRNLPITGGAIALGLAVIIAIGALASSGGGDGPEPAEPPAFALEARGRADMNETEALQVAERLEREADAADRAEEAPIRAALGYAYVRARARARAIPAYARAVDIDPRVLEERDLAALSSLLILERPHATKVEEILKKAGSRAVPHLNELASDDTRDATLRRRADELAQVIVSSSDQAISSR